MAYRYWIDKNGGWHFHNNPDCPAKLKTPQHEERYSEIFRDKEHMLHYKEWRYIRVREDGKYYIPCPLCFGKSRFEEK